MLDRIDTRLQRLMARPSELARWIRGGCRPLANEGATIQRATTLKQILSVLSASVVVANVYGCDPPSSELEGLVSTEDAARRKADGGKTDAGATSSGDAAAEASTSDAGTDASSSSDTGTDAGSVTEGGTADGGDAAVVGCAIAPTSALVADAKHYGAVGDGKADDTAAIQAAINAVAGTGGTAYVPPGTYMININANLPGTGRPYGLGVGSNMTLRLDPNATLKVIPNSEPTYGLIGVNVVQNVSIVGGTLVGDKYTHTGTTGDNGFGIWIYSSTHVAVEGVTAKQFWGDGFFVKGLHQGTPRASQLEFCGVLADDNRRQGMSLTDADGVIIRDSTFQNTGGTWPMAGIDIEPDGDETVANVQILRSRFLDNKGAGVLLTLAPSYIGSSFITNVTVKDNVMIGNGTANVENLFQPSDGITLLHTGGHTITGNTLERNVDDGIGIRQSSNTNTVSGNAVVGNGRYGIHLNEQSTGNTVSSNGVCGNAAGQIQDAVGTNTVTANAVNAVCP